MQVVVLFFDNELIGIFIKYKEGIIDDTIDFFFLLKL